VIYFSIVEIIQLLTYASFCKYAEIVIAQPTTFTLRGLVLLVTGQWDDPGFTGSY